MRTAQQPRWAFEYSIDSAVTVNVTSDFSEEEEKIVYLGEGSQIGYLPALASSELGW